MTDDELLQLKFYCAKMGETTAMLRDLVARPNRNIRASLLPSNVVAEERYLRQEEAGLNEILTAAFAMRMEVLLHAKRNELEEYGLAIPELGLNFEEMGIGDEKPSADAENVESEETPPATADAPKLVIVP